MRFAAIALVATAASAHSSHNQHAHLHNKRAGSAPTVVTTGAKGLGDGQIHTRLEITELTKRPEQWALFIQAMDKFQEANTANTTSYYGIASIHGVPRQDWDGVPQCESCGGADGYCPHDSVLFPAWHRAYMALYEQEFLGFAYEVANSYPDEKREAMLSAASTLRFPYWDWAAKPDSGSVLPTIMSSAQITYDGANGEETINNPLYTFDLPDKSAMYYGPFTSWGSTLRWPNSNNADATSQDASAVSSFDSIRSNMANSVYNLLTVCSDYLHFSNDQAGSSTTTCTNSLEGIHNTIHTTSGGPGANGVSGGHMTYLPLAAFDPIFWLHHCNVDRLFTLWQTVNPDSYGATQTAPHNTWTIASGSQQGPDSPLEPFRKDASNFWTTNDVRDWSSTFSYTYPEFSTSDGSRSAIISYINELYGSDASLTASSISEKVQEGSANNSTASSTSSAVSSTSTSSVASSSSYSSSTGTSTGTAKTTSVSSSAPKRVASFTSTKTGSHGSLSTGIAGPINSTHSLTNSTGLTTSNGSEYQYVCNVHCPRYALNGSYYVYVFDGQPAGSDASQYLTDKNLIGAVGVLGGGEMTANVSIAGSVPLTRYLQGKVKNGSLKSMSHNVTVPYLAKNLNWKIVKEGAEIHPAALGGFQASVYSAVSSPGGKDTLPVWSAYQPQVQATKGKAGGLQWAPAYNGTSGSTGSSGGVSPAPGSNNNATAPAYTPVQSKVPTGTPYAAPTTYSTAAPSPTSYTGAANKASFGVAGVLAVAGLVAML